MVSSTVESEWDDEQRGLVVAADYVERMTGRYGEWIPEATSDAADPTNYSEHPVRYLPTGPHTNWAEKAAKDAEAAARKKEGANLNGVFFGVERKEF